MPPRRSRAVVRTPHMVTAIANQGQVEDDNESMAQPSRRRRSDSGANASDPASDASEDAIGPEALYSSHDQMVKKLVRLALASEVNRRPIRRTDISEKVLGSSSRAFKKVFEDANKQLQNVFGMTLTELPQKEKITTAQKRQAQKASAQSQIASANSNKSYELTTTLALPFRKPAVLPPMKTPSVELEAQYTGFCTWMVTIIMLSTNKRVSEHKMESYLTKMNADVSVAGDRTDRVLKRMEREGYITKIKERDGGGEETVDWVVGPRGKVEIGEAGVAGMVRDVYSAKDDELETLEDQLDNSLGEGTFRRKTRKGGGNANGDGNDEDVEMADSRGRVRVERRRTRQSEAAEEQEEEDGEEEEEDDDQNAEDEDEG